MTKQIIYDLEAGKGGLKYYTYYITGIKRITTKATILEAIKLGLEVQRKDKIMGTIEVFDYQSQRFIEVKQ